MAEKLIQVQNLKKYFPIKKGVFSRVAGHVRAVDDVSFTINRQETVGLVGESGCGKTTVGRTLLRLIEPTAGSAMFGETDIFSCRSEELRELRQSMQIIFQDPYGSLNPRMTVEQIVGEGLAIHGLAERGERRSAVTEILRRVGLQPEHMSRYPHEFSGGQRQRIGIARALVLNPEFVVCDEAVSALDVSIQAQIINLLEELQQEMQLSYLFISHDLGVVEHISDRVLVMYFGKIVESAPTEEIFSNPVHPYTKALLSAVPRLDPKQRRERIVWPPGGTTPEEARARMLTQQFAWREVSKEHWVLEEVT
jgi:ABC-type oligopeptide transport system ATPase subunit